MPRFEGGGDTQRIYARACAALARAHDMVMPRRANTGFEEGSGGLAEAISVSRLPLEPRTVSKASRMAAALTGAAFLSGFAVSCCMLGSSPSAALLLLALVSPVLAWEALRSYPRVLSRRVAAEVIKDSTGAINLMVMSLRREPSLSTAIAFSAARSDRFSAQLKECTWGVVMGRFASFEEALQDLAERWSAYAGELKTAINALITASCEATEDGRRRALDRANSASVTGVKRRIEEYTLSLSTPSMLMFGVAILLPLMVGSFLPMMSWDVWTGAEGAAGGGPDVGTVGLLQVVFIMNILFPAIGLLVSMGSVSKHPLDCGREGQEDPRIARNAIIPAAVAALCSGLASVLALEGVLRAAALLLSATVPVSLALIFIGSKGPATGRKDGVGAEEALFRTGARMVEGENLEQALSAACVGQRGSLRAYSDGGVLRSCADAPRSGEASLTAVDSQAAEALNVVRKAAAKDEQAAGLLAMDLATYLRDLRETERSLRSRLKPTISMMRMTSYALAPVVLGVTFGMYLTLGTIAGGSDGSLDPGTFLLVLGVFLAESNAIVQYFIWGIEASSPRCSLASSAGLCILISELLFVATAMVAA